MPIIAELLLQFYLLTSTLHDSGIKSFTNCCYLQHHKSQALYCTHPTM